MSSRLKAYLLLLITAVIWGWASPVIKHTTNFIPPTIFLSYRFFLSSLVAVFFLLFARPRLPKTSREWLHTLIYGFIVSTLTLGLLFVGAAYSSSLVSAISSAIQPMMASAAGVMFLHEHVTKKEKAGITLALLGTLVITLEPLFGSRILAGTLLGNFLLLLSRVTDTISSILAKTLLRVKISPAALTHLSFLTGFVTILPITLFLHSPQEIISSVSLAPLSAHLGVFYMAFISGTLAYTFWHIAQKTIEVGEATISYYLHPLAAAPLSLFWLKEPLTPGFIFGSMTIFIGVVIAESRRSLIPKFASKHRRV